MCGDRYTGVGVFFFITGLLITGLPHGECAPFRVCFFRHFHTQTESSPTKAQRLRRIPDAGDERYVSHLITGMLLNGLGRHTKSFKHFKYALKVRPESVSLLEEAGKQLIRMGKIRKGAFFFETALDLGSDSRFIKYWLKQYYAENPIELYRRYSEKKRHNFNAFKNLALAYRNLKKYEDAVSVCWSFIVSNPSSFRMYLLLGQLYEESDSDVTLNFYRQMIYQFPRKPLPYLKAAFTAEDRNDYRTATGIIDLALKRRVEYPEFLVYKADLLIKQQQYKEALVWSEKAVYAIPQSTSALFAAAVASDRVGYWLQAQRYLERFVQIEPGDPHANNFLGYLYAENGVFLEKAAELVESALKKDSDNGAYLDSLGWVYYKMQDYSKAHAYLERANQQLKNDPVILEHLGEVLYQLNQKEKAWNIWKQALELDPNSSSLKKRLQQTN